MFFSKVIAARSLLLFLFLGNSTCFVTQLPVCFTHQKTQQPQQPWTNRRATGADIEQESATESESPAVAEAVAAPSRGKVNEIDFCIAPADVSLSRSYASASNKSSSSSTTLLVAPDTSSQSPVLSLTRALNNASNRAVRRILLARAWPSAEALNKSFRQAAMAEKQREAALAAENGEGSTGGVKCPVPRPILNLLVRRRVDKKIASGGEASSASVNEKGVKQSSRRSRTDEEYVTDQLNSFRERYGNLPGYSFAEAYLESVLSLATSGKESPRVKDVRYDSLFVSSFGFPGLTSPCWTRILPIKYLCSFSPDLLHSVYR